jgi:RimJ/RimL family protein N-acetyltransferase
VELETPRLRLRPFTASDRDAIHAVYSDAEVMRHVGHGSHRTTA